MPDNILQCREERERLWDVDVLIDGDCLVHFISNVWTGAEKCRVPITMVPASSEVHWAEDWIVGIGAYSDL